MLDLKVYAQKLRENAITDDNGIVKVSPELWEQIAGVIEWAADRWIRVEDKLPESGVHVLLCCEVHRYGGGVVGKYVCDGYHAEANTHPAGGFPDECACEYSEEDDEYYLCEGWYEVIKNWDDYNSIAIADDVTHWMPLPDLPEEETEAADCVADACPLTGCGCGEADE